ncbi:MAG: hypothetical protein IPN53_05440 [Comamonadaceae bacterium]|nr:hypothetical protein [Comamonadaceae bacterium]
MTIRAAPRAVAARPIHPSSTVPTTSSGTPARKGWSSTKFVNKEYLPEVRKQFKNYQLMKLLMEKWIELAMELSILRLAKKPAQ